MTMALHILQGAFIVCALAWKSFQLATSSEQKQPSNDHALRAIVACLAVAGVAYALQMIVDTGTSGPVRPMILSTFQNVLLMCVLYVLIVVFSFIAYDSRKAARRAYAHFFPLLGMGGLALVAAASVPDGTPARDFTVPQLNITYLTYDFYLLYGFIAVLLTVVRCNPDRVKTLRNGIAITSLGLVFGELALATLTAVQVFFLCHITVPSVTTRVAGTVELGAILVFLVGICYPGAATRLDAARVWRTQLSDLAELAFLRDTLIRTFPTYVLQSPGQHWWNRHSLLHVSTCWVLCYLECRNCLVDLSPYLADLVASPELLSTRELARYLPAALQARAAGREVGVSPVAVATPPATGLDGDIAELVALSKEFRRRSDDAVV
jgi:hypothetical protein